jgi:hypothetical protein
LQIQLRKNQNKPPVFGPAAFFVHFAPILSHALSRYHTGILHITILKHDGIIPVIRLHQGGRT